jgi:hypothetical protein
MYIEENTQFQLKVVKKSGLDVDGTYLPPAIHPSIADEPKTDMKTAMLEAEMVMGGAVSDLLEKTGALHAKSMGLGPQARPRRGTWARRAGAWPRGEAGRRRTPAVDRRAGCGQGLMRRGAAHRLCG